MIQKNREEKGMIREVIFDIDDTLYNYETGHALGMKRMAEYARKEFAGGI